jgi:hypothetical protein
LLTVPDKDDTGKLALTVSYDQVCGAIGFLAFHSINMTNLSEFIYHETSV